MLRKMMFLSISIGFLFFFSCMQKESPRKVSLAKKEVSTTKAIKEDGVPLRIAVGGMITPKEGYAYYKQFLAYIGEKLGLKVEFVDRDDYTEINKMIGAGNVDIAFVCGGPYVDGRNEFGFELIAAPVAYGETVYYSYIIVHRDSGIREFNDLRGKQFAFTDPLSNTGTLVPTYLLARMRETPKSFFKRQVYVGTHDRAIQAVAERVVDGAAVDSLIWEYKNRKKDDFTSLTRIILKSPPYGIPPVVVPNSLDPELKKRIREVFLNAHKDSRGAEILKKMMIEKFVKIDDSKYDSIRQMKRWIERRGKAKDVK